MKRIALVLALAAFGGCGSGEQSGSPNTPELASPMPPNLGYYATQFELVEYEATGFPAGEAEEMRQSFAATIPQSLEFCLREEDLGQEFSQFLAVQAEEFGNDQIEPYNPLNCREMEFSVDGASFSAALVCASFPGVDDRSWTASGEATENTVTLEFQSEDDLLLDPEFMLSMTEEELAAAPKGHVQILVRTMSRRVGDCPDF